MSLRKTIPQDRDPQYNNDINSDTQNNAFQSNNSQNIGFRQNNFVQNNDNQSDDNQNDDNQDNDNQDKDNQNSDNQINDNQINDNQNNDNQSDDNQNDDNQNDDNQNNDNQNDNNQNNDKQNIDFFEDMYEQEFNITKGDKSLTEYNTKINQLFEIILAQKNNIDKISKDHQMSQLQTAKTNNYEKLLSDLITFQPKLSDLSASDYKKKIIFIKQKLKELMKTIKDKNNDNINQKLSDLLTRIEDDDDNMESLHGNDYPNKMRIMLINVNNELIQISNLVAKEETEKSNDKIKRKDEYKPIWQELSNLISITLDKPTYIKKKLYKLVETIQDIDEGRLNRLAMSIKNFILIEYPHGLWQDDFNYIIFDQLLQQFIIQDRNPFYPHIRPSSYIYLFVIQLFLEKDIPDQSYLFYDEIIFKIFEIYNLFLEESQKFKNININDDGVLSSYIESIQKLILNNIKEFIMKFKKCYNDPVDFAKQIRIMTHIVDESIDTITPLVYECFELFVQYYYDKLYTVMQDLFEISISHLKDNTKQVFKFSLEFWGTVAKTEKKVGFERSKHYILGAIRFIVDKYLLPSTTICRNDNKPDDPTDDNPQIYYLATECLKLISKVEPDEMFGKLSRYFKDRYKNPKVGDRLSSLLSYQCIVSSSEYDESKIKYIEETVNIILEFAKGINEKLKYIALCIIKKIITKFPEIIMKKQERLNSMITIILSNRNSLILIKCYEIFSLILKQFPSPESSFDISDFDNYIDFIFVAKKYEDNNVRSAAINYSIDLFEKAPPDCNEKLLIILNNYLNNKKDPFNLQVKGDESDIQDNIDHFEGQVIVNVFPVIVKKLRSHPDININNIIKKILNLFGESPTDERDCDDVEREILEAVIEIIPLTKYIRFKKFGDQLLKIFYEYHSTNDALTMELTSSCIATLFENFPKQLDESRLEDITKILLDNLSSEILTYRALRPVFYLLSSIIAIADTRFEPYCDKFEGKIKEITKSIHIQERINDIGDFIDENDDDDLLDLCYEILNTYFVFIDVFKKEIVKKNVLEFVKNIKTQIIILLKKLEKANLCYEAMLEIAIKSIFIIICVFDATSFLDLSHPLIMRIIKRGSVYKDNEAVSSVSKKILMILSNYE